MDIQNTLSVIKQIEKGFSHKTTTVQITINPSALIAELEMLIDLVNHMVSEDITGMKNGDIQIEIKRASKSRATGNAIKKVAEAEAHPELSEENS